MAKKPTSDQKLYRNAGVSSLMIEGVEMEPGSEFRATLDPEFETQMLSGGHLELLQDQSERADQAQARAAEQTGTVTNGVVDEDETPARKRRNT